MAMMTHPRPLLSVSPVREDHAALRGLLEDGSWLIRESHSLRSALMVLEEYRIPLVICERDLHPGTWKDLLEQISTTSDPPAVIVACRQADERLWAEALSAGAFDVLAKPFNCSDLQRTLSHAWQHWHHRFAADEPPEQLAAAI